MRNTPSPESGSTEEGIPPQAPAQETPPADNTFAEERLHDSGGDSLLEDIRRVVFDEYDRALMYGTASRRAVELQKKHAETVVEFSVACVELLRNNGISITEQQRKIIQICAYLHDALKIVPEREPLGDNEVDGDEARLLMHGEDSAEWADQLLSHLRFSPGLISRIKKALMAHMPMPYVEKKLAEAQKRPDGSSQILPEHLEEGKYPLPRTIEAAVLLAADFLSMSVMAGPDLNLDPVAGCFDRILHIELQRCRAEELSPQRALEGAIASLRENVERLQNPPKATERPKAAQVEKILGETIGKEVLVKVTEFIDWLDGANLAGESISGFSDLAVYRTTESGEKELDPDATLSRYYQAVTSYRELHNLSVENIIQR